MANLVDAIIAGEVGVNMLLVSQAAMWTQQIMGAYSLLYPFMELDFRHVRDCEECHRMTNLFYQKDVFANHAHTHTTLAFPTDKFGFSLIDNRSYPRAKVGFRNVGTYQLRDEARV